MTMTMVYDVSNCSHSIWTSNLKSTDSTLNVDLTTYQIGSKSQFVIRSLGLTFVIIILIPEVASDEAIVPGIDSE